MSDEIEVIHVYNPVPVSASPRPSIWSWSKELRRVGLDEELAARKAAGTVYQADLNIQLMRQLGARWLPHMGENEFMDAIIGNELAGCARQLGTIRDTMYNKRKF